MKNIFPIILLILGYFLFKKSKLNKPSETTQASNITPQEADDRANEIHDAWGLLNDDEDLIFKHLKDVNRAAYTLISQSYGNRKATATTANKNLTDTLNYMLTKSEIAELKKLNPVLNFLNKS